MTTAFDGSEYQVRRAENRPPMSRETIQEIVKVITRHLSPRRIIMFGSYARGEAGPDSDLDLFIELDPPLPERGRSGLVKTLFDPYPGPMDIVVYSPDEVAYWKQAPASLVASVMREGEVLYERGSGWPFSISSFGQTLVSVGRERFAQCAEQSESRKVRK